MAQAAVQDADESVGELAQGGVMTLATRLQRVVIGAGSGQCGQRAEGLLVQRVREPPSTTFLVPDALVTGD